MPAAPTKPQSSKEFHIHYFLNTAVVKFQKVNAGGQSPQRNVQNPQTTIFAPFLFHPSPRFPILPFPTSPPFISPANFGCSTDQQI